MLSKARENLDFMYFIKFLASISVSNAPIEINVGVAETKDFQLKVCLIPRQ